MSISRQAALGILVLLPSMWLAWTWRAMPQLGFYHDDSVYWVSAESLAQGHGYRILSLPGQPFQTKYPPLFPALLAVAWKLNPAFPSNLPLATGMLWCLFPIYLGLVCRLFRSYGFSLAEQMALLSVAALNPLAILLSFSMMPELLLVCLLLASFQLRHPVLRAVAAGLAYLAKASTLPLLAAVPVAYVLRKQYRRAGIFIMTMLPAVVAWQVWVQAHLKRSGDLVTLYYTDYVGFQFYNVPWKDLPLVVWHNLDSFLMAIGKLLTFDTALFESKHIERIVAIGAIAGVVRLARRTGNFDYPLFGLGFSAMLLMWHYQPDQRFVFPLYPLLLAGLWTEARNIAAAVKTTWSKQSLPDRIAAALFGASLPALALLVIAGSLLGTFVFLPRVLGAYQSDLAARRPAYRWLEDYLPARANVFAYDDPLIYLYAKRHACNLPIPTRLYYHDDQAGIDRLVDGIPAFSKQHQLDYLLLTPDDFYRDLHEARAQRLARVLRADPDARELYRSPAAVIYGMETHTGTK